MIDTTNRLNRFIQKVAFEKCGEASIDARLEV